jgi:tetratricopeptide (TPR) repeat protein
VFALPPTALAFRQAAPGAALRNRTLPTTDGRREPWLAAARANVFVFVRSGQEHSLTALRHLAALRDELRGRSVRIVAIASGDDPGAAELARAAGGRFPVLVDAGDVLYGELGVAMHPSAGVADQRHRLVAHQPYRAVNFREALRARIQHALGEIDDAALAAALDPPAAPTAADRAGARAALARKLLALGAVEAAVASARAAVERDARDPDARAALAETLAAAGRCAEAEREREEAARLAPDAPRPALACRR